MRSHFLGRFWVKIDSDYVVLQKRMSTERMLWAACFSLMLTFVYNFNKTPWFLLRWMVRFLTFVHKDLFPDDKSLWTTVRNLTKWPSTSTGTMVLCWSCKQSERERQNKQPTAFSVLIRFWSTHQNLFSPRNGREISSSVFGQSRLGQLYGRYVTVQKNRQSENMKVSIKPTNQRSTDQPSHRGRC